MITKKLTKRQACQTEFLSRLNFIIFYTMDKNNIKIDTLICRLNDNPVNDYDDW